MHWNVLCVVFLGVVAGRGSAGARTKYEVMLLRSTM